MSLHPFLRIRSRANLLGRRSSSRNPLKSPQIHERRNMLIGGEGRARLASSMIECVLAVTGLYVSKLMTLQAGTRYRAVQLQVLRFVVLSLRLTPSRPLEFAFIARSNMSDCMDSNPRRPLSGQWETAPSSRLWKG